MRQHRSLEQGQIPDVREVVTTRDEGATQTFAFALKGDYLESTAEIPEPHAFKAALKCGSQRHDFVFEETVLLLCMQLKEISLGVVLVLCFSIGLALTMVSAGVLAALSVEHVSRRWSGFSTLARRAPYLSGALIILVGLYTGAEGWRSLHRAAEHSAAITITSG